MEDLLHSDTSTVFRKMATLVPGQYFQVLALPFLATGMEAYFQVLDAGSALPFLATGMEAAGSALPFLATGMEAPLATGFGVL